MSLCEILDWDSRFFGRTIARYRRPCCAGAELEALAAECADRAIACVYLQIHPADRDSVVSLARTGAIFADVRLTYDGAVTPLEETPLPPGTIVRRATDADVPQLRTLAAASHRLTRFYADPHFSESRCDCLYETWIDNSVQGYADEVLVVDLRVDESMEIAGYVTCHREAAGHGRIGLFAVAGHRKGRGIGSALLNAAFAWFQARGVASVSVATQLRNARAIRIYERAGLTLSEARVWFHYWS